MCNPIAVHFPDRVLAQGEYMGYRWEVIHNQYAQRCGYIRVPPGHPWHGKTYGDIDAEVHGGLTFSEPDQPCAGQGADDGWWLGFDCGHAWDLPDPELLRECHELIWTVFDGLRDFGAVVRTQEYVETECRSLCEQAVKACSDYRVSTR